ncbi:MAG: hypothetical protein KBE65_00640 [Phycisphaerae bacterium]|nr:hypothetical protein [Phycisphaerae bacterium]
MQFAHELIVGWRAATLLGVCLLAGTLRANIGIKPAYVEVNLDEGRPAGTFLISNLGNTEERFRINAVHFVYTEKGGLRRCLKGDYSLAPYIRFNPRELTLPPNTQRAVRFAVVTKGPLVEGEWWAAMELESLATNEIVANDEKSGRSVKLKTVSTILAPIFGTVGKTSYQGQVKDVLVEIEKGAIVLKTLVASTGNGRLGIKGDYEILDKAGTVLDRGPTGTGYVLRGAQRWLTKEIETPIPQGECRVRVTFSAVHLEQPLVKEVAVTWPQAPVQATETAGPTVQPASDAIPKPQPQDPTEGNSQAQTQGSVTSSR